MSKTIYQTVNKTRIYPIEYLANNELTESDLNAIFDYSKKCLLYSLIIGMFKFIDSSKKNSQIIKDIKENNWYDSITWTAKQCKEYEGLVINAYKNIYQYKNEQAESLAQWFIINYGLKVKNNNFNLFD